MGGCLGVLVIMAWCWCSSTHVYRCLGVPEIMDRCLGAPAIMARCLGVPEIMARCLGPQ
jgi:hypothetical protein